MKTHSQKYAKYWGKGTVTTLAVSVSSEMHAVHNISYKLIKGTSREPTSLLLRRQDIRLDKNHNKYFLY